LIYYLQLTTHNSLTTYYPRCAGAQGLLDTYNLQLTTHLQMTTQERKGAIRELRKDAAFLGQQKVK